METVIFLWIVGIALVYVAIKHSAPKIIVGIGIGFLVLGLAVLMDWGILSAFLIGGAMGFVCVSVGVDMFVVPFRFQTKIKRAVYKGAKSSGHIKMKFGHQKGFKLIFEIENGGKGQEVLSYDKYLQSEVEKRFQKNQCYTIWINNAGECRVSRWKHFFMSIVMILVGLACLGVPIYGIFLEFF